MKYAICNTDFICLIRCLLFGFAIIFGITPASRFRIIHVVAHRFAIVFFSPQTSSVDLLSATSCGVLWASQYLIRFVSGFVVAEFEILASELSMTKPWYFFSLHKWCSCGGFCEESFCWRRLSRFGNLFHSLQYVHVQRCEGSAPLAWQWMNGQTGTNAGAVSIPASPSTTDVSTLRFFL